LKSLGLAVVILFGGLLIYGTLDFPGWGDPDSPASRHVSPRYIEKTLEETAVPNVVTSVLADYRGFDTLFETTVIFTAGLACFFLLRTQRKAPGARLYRHLPTGIVLRIEKGGRLPDSAVEFERIDSTWVPHDLIIKKTCRMIIPFIQLYSLYVIAHGHHSPGGGFQGGVIFGAAFILFAVSHDLREGMQRLNEKTTIFLCSLGVFIYAGVGTFCLFFERNFLDYSALAKVLGVDAVMARSHGIMMVEIGVGIAVMAVMFAIYVNLSSVGKQDEGL